MTSPTDGFPGGLVVGETFSTRRGEITIARSESPAVFWAAAHGIITPPLLREDLAARLVEVGLTAADVMLGVEHFVFTFFLQAGIGAVGGDFGQGFFQAGLLVAVAVGLGLFDLAADGLAFGGAACERLRVFGGQQWRAHEACEGQQGKGGEKFHIKLQVRNQVAGWCSKPIYPGCA